MTKSRKQQRADSQRKAAAAYVSEFERINGLLAKISDGIINHENASGQKNWGHVGDLKHLADQLQNLSDQINNEGEYAPENVA